MFKNYLKIAWRNLFRNKGFSITNILGLIIGITCTMLILFWVQDEITYDKFHKNYDNIYQVIANRDFKNEIFTDRNMVFPLSKELETGFPHIKNAVVITYPQSHVLTVGDTRLTKSGYTVGGKFFDMFSWKVLQGNAAAAINDPTSIVLTRSTAVALFGNGDPLNKVLRFDNDRDLKVAAVVADPPGNSTLTFDYVHGFNYSDPRVQRDMNEWRNSSWNVFVQVAPGTTIAQIGKSINEVHKKHTPDENISTYFAFPMNRWRLYSDFKDGKNTGGAIDYVKLFSIIAVVILLIACINFMNLSTARSEKRAKEVGIRKTLGSDRKQLAVQFFFESMILTLIAFLFSVLAVYLLLPSFNLLVSKQLSLDLQRPYFWLAGLAIILFTGLIAGSYPALYLSSFNPIRVLKGTFLPGKSAILPRRILVISQFAISILLISATIIVYRQIQHVQNRDMGYNPDNLIMMRNNADLSRNYVALRQDLLNTGMVEGVTRSLSPITQIWWRSPSPDWEGKPANSNIIVSGQLSDVDYFKTVGIKVLEGKDFSGTPADSANMMINQAAVQSFGLKNPLGMVMRYAGRTYTVIGVAGNVVMGSPYVPVDPMIYLFNPDASNSISVRLKKTVQPQQVLPSIEAIVKKYNPSFPFEYQFADEEFGRKFANEELIGKLTNIFAALGIFICCIGLAGLASFTIEKRFREIGIRKVLGASVQQLLLLISKEFLKLVLIAFVIAVPFTWWFMESWFLQKYEYRTGISGWIFGIVGIMILALTLIVVSLNTLRAALANPVKSLRTE